MAPLIAEHDAPLELHRSHWVLYVVSAVACQAAATTLTGALCWTPRVLSAGGCVTDGSRPPTTAEGVATAVLAPEVLVAVTATVTRKPSSAAASWYVTWVAPGITVQLAPDALHRSH